MGKRIGVMGGSQKVARLGQEFPDPSPLKPLFLECLVEDRNPGSPLRTSSSGGQPAREIWELLGSILRICEGERGDSCVLRTMRREICLAGIRSQVKLHLRVKLMGNFQAVQLCYRGHHMHLWEWLSLVGGHWILHYEGKFVGQLKKKTKTLT